MIRPLPAPFLIVLVHVETGVYFKFGCLVVVVVVVVKLLLLLFSCCCCCWIVRLPIRLNCSVLSDGMSDAIPFSQIYAADSYEFSRNTQSWQFWHLCNF